MPTLGNPIYNWDAPCQEQELIRWKSVVEDNFKIIKQQMMIKQLLLEVG